MDMESMVRRARGGEREALAALCTHFHPQMYRFFRRMNLPEADADDLAQSTLLRMMEKLDTFRFLPGQRFEGWLYRIAYNQFIDLKRKKQTLPLAQDAPIPDPAPLPEQTLIRSENERAVRQAVRSLDEEAQALISLRYELDMPYRDIAQALGISVVRVKWRLHESLKQLKSTLQEGGHAP